MASIKYSKYEGGKILILKIVKALYMKITLILYNVYVKFVILLFKEEICDNVLSNVMLLSKFCSFMFTVQFVDSPITTRGIIYK
jgi:hypothetical protein